MTGGVNEGEVSERQSLWSLITWKWRSGLCGVVSDLVDASASALQDDDLQQFGSVTLCVLTCIYGQHLQQVKGQKSWPVKDPR